MMTKTESSEQARTAHRALLQARDGLTDEQVVRSQLTPQWSVKDVLAHSTAWLIHGAEQWCDIQQGTWTLQKWNQEAIDRFNAEAIEKWDEHVMTEARTAPASAYEQMEQRILSLPDEIDESSVSFKPVRAVVLKHMADHAAQIKAWRQSLSNA